MTGRRCRRTTMRASALLKALRSLALRKVVGTRPSRGASFRFRRARIAGVDTIGRQYKVITRLVLHSDSARRHLDSAIPHGLKRFSEASANREILLSRSRKCSLRDHPVGSRRRNSLERGYWNVDAPNAAYQNGATNLSLFKSTISMVSRMTGTLKTCGCSARIAIARPKLLAAGMSSGQALQEGEPRL